MTGTDRVSVLARIEELFLRRGAEAYLGELVTVAEHMLQCAALAEAEGASNLLIAAALLHDIGHLCGAGEYTPEDTVDRGHEKAGAAMLAGYFPEAVVAAIRLHVAAKRYLCAIDSAYCAKLTAASRHSLALQGGAMDSAEIVRFEREPHYEAAVQVRLWDDRAKDSGVIAPSFRHFVPLLETL